MNRKLLIAAPALAVIAVAGCHGGGTDSTNIRAAKADTANLKPIAAKCGTVSATGQITAVKDMRTHDGREALLAKCGVPKSKVPAVETAALSAAEHAHLFTGGKSARLTYFEVTLPKIVEANQA